MKDFFVDFGRYEKREASAEASLEICIVAARVQAVRMRQERFPEKIARKDIHMPHMRISVAFMNTCFFMAISPEKKQKSNDVDFFD